MARIANLEELLFPVEEHPVFAAFSEDGKERRLPVPDKKAIVNRNSHRVLGVVGRGYRLVSNREALDMGLECCQIVFPETKPGEWEAKSVDAPSTGGHCHIDLVHNSAALDFTFVRASRRPEAFGPFIRITNSYNALRALSFDVGFYRKVCKNGLIVPDTIIRFTFTHLRRDIGETVRFHVAKDRLSKFRTAFGESLSALRDCEVPRSDFETVICAVLLLRPPEPLEADSREASDWHELRGLVAEMSTRYAVELGENAYAIFNAITEFASHPPDNRCLHRDRNSLQRLAGSWLIEFNHASRQLGFSMTSHLEQLAKERRKVGRQELEVV